jgi:hypothetical protein
MKVIVPFLSTLAALVTIAAGVVRIRWTAVQRRIHNSPRTGREGLPTWVKRVLTAWLIFVGGTITFVFIYVVIRTIVELSH